MVCFQILGRIVLMHSGKTGLGGTTLLPEPASNIEHDINFIVAAREAIMAQPPKKAWFVVTGPCTNAALLFAAFPEVVDHLAGYAFPF
jgi:uridine nucleosidase